MTILRKNFEILEALKLEFRLFLVIEIQIQCYKL